MKIGRNEPCPCGSGKKYKKCCLLTKTQAPTVSAPFAGETDFSYMLDDVHGWRRLEYAEVWDKRATIYTGTDQKPLF